MGNRVEKLLNELIEILSIPGWPPLLNDMNVMVGLLTDLHTALLEQQERGGEEEDDIGGTEREETV